MARLNLRQVAAAREGLTRIAYLLNGANLLSNENLYYFIEDCLDGMKAFGHAEWRLTRKSMGTKFHVGNGLWFLATDVGDFQEEVERLNETLEILYYNIFR